MIFLTHDKTLKSENTEGSYFFTKFKLLTMSFLELKGELLDMISEFKSEKQLLRLHQVAQEISDEETSEEDWWDNLSEERKVLLDKAIEESYDPKNWISHEEVKKKHTKWLSK